MCYLFLNFVTHVYSKRHGSGRTIEMHKCASGSISECHIKKPKTQMHFTSFQHECLLPLKPSLYFCICVAARICVTKISSSAHISEGPRRLSACSMNVWHAWIVCGHQACLCMQTPKIDGTMCTSTVSVCFGLYLTTDNYCFVHWNTNLKGKHWGQKLSELCSLKVHKVTTIAVLQRWKINK